MILVTLVCCYAACWGPTKKWGTEDVSPLGVAPSVPVAPLIVASPQHDWDRQPFCETRHYYFWFFGYVAKLPYELDIK